MEQGFIKVAAVTPKIKVADPVYNGSVICERLWEACGRGAKIVVFPELCLTGYTCGDLFLQQLLLRQAEAQLLRIAEETRDRDALVMIGLPIEREGRLYNVAAVLCRGEILGFVPKANIPSYAEFYEGRHFSRGNREALKRLAELPVGFQVNAGALLHWRTRRTGLELLKMSRLPLLGSDCHNLTTRVPNLKEGRSMVERKLGEAFLRRMDENAALVCGLGFARP